MTKKIITGLNIYAEDQVLTESAVLIDDEVIAAVGKDAADLEVERFEFPADWHLIPGMIDMHIHGVAGADVMDGSLAALNTISNALVKEGVTAFVATTMAADTGALEQVLPVMADVIVKRRLQGAELLGVHLEGPFLSANKAGAQVVDNLRQPSIALLEKWQQLAHGMVKMVTVAPELSDSMQLIKWLREKGVIAALGHTDADYDLACEAIAVGATQATHLFNTMRPLHHRDPGAAMALLLDDRVIAELIADGVHLHVALLQLVYRVKGADKIVLISDAMRAKGLPDGEYELGGQRVMVADGVARLLNGALAGSCLTLERALVNMMAAVGCSLSQAIKMVSANPAKQLGVFACKGSIAVAKHADLVVLDQNFKVQMTMVQGRVVYRGQ